MNINDFIQYLKNPGLLNADTLTELEKFAEDYPAFDLGWAVLLKNYKNLQHENYLHLLPKVSIRISDRKWLKKFLEMPVGYIETEKPEYLSIEDYFPDSQADIHQKNEPIQSGKMSLIENFLANGGKIERKAGKLPEASATDLSEKAITVNDDIVTETFANILYDQGNLEKALDAFKKLSLKYPEKSIYFAARIEEIQSKLDH